MAGSAKAKGKCTPQKVIRSLLKCVVEASEVVRSPSWKKSLRFLQGYPPILPL
ncbi:Activator of [Sesbania bispinosa]|nr:Activator of [Sesbania bispinosa]